MAKVDELYGNLRIAAALLDVAAGNIRDLPLLPVQDNIRRVGEALVSIFDIMRAVYVIRPDLTPSALGKSDTTSEAQQRLTQVLADAIRLNESGQIAEVIEGLSTYASSETSELHKTIALDWIDRMKKESNS